jgi:signal transduction histidine kinase
MFSRKFSLTAARFDRASLIRHLAICVAGVTAYLLREELHTGNDILWILGIAVLLNAGTNVLSSRPRWTSFARPFSTLCSLFSWAALVRVTGGVGSPFVAGFEIEIVLSVLTFTPLNTTLTTLGSIAGLWTQQWLLGPAASPLSLPLQTGFLLGTGTLTYYVARRWDSRQEQLSARATDLAQRLRSLEIELEDANLLGRLGEDVVRVAHSLKNAVCSLRGFCSLIEARLTGSPGDREALDGLRATITRLEEITRTTLRPPRAGPDDGAREGAGLIHLAIEEVIEEVGRAHPGVRWIRPPPGVCSKIALPPGLLREVLLLLAQNAAEAVGESGEIQLETLNENGALRIEVRDSGPGVTADMRETLFRPGMTTKPGGSGFGLFLARRLVESYGGSLTSNAPGGRGAVFTVHLPVHGN